MSRALTSVRDALVAGAVAALAAFGCGGGNDPIDAGVPDSGLSDGGVPIYGVPGPSGCSAVGGGEATIVSALVGAWLWRRRKSGGVGPG